MFRGPIDRADAVHARIGAMHLDLFRLIADVDRCGAWEEEGARDTAHWLAMRYGMSEWKARRWVVAAHALEALPQLASALASGLLGVDTVVELARFATPETEARLVSWAQGVSFGAVRHRADLEARRAREDVAEIERSRTVSWWYFDEGRRFGLEAELPAAQGAIVATALERMAATIPAMPDEPDTVYADARRADALVALCSSRLAEDPDADRATVVIHANGSSGGAGDLEGDGVAPAQTLERLLCDARVQTVVEREDGEVLMVGRASRQPTTWMLRQIRYRDRGCRFPGCGIRRFAEAHHVRWWRNGGRTELDNLVLICSFHHRLVHELGWHLEGTAADLRWSRPDGTRYRAGPAPPRAARSPHAEEPNAERGTVALVG
jgi:hypothetical protein